MKGDESLSSEVHKHKHFELKRTERSFSLLETIVAVSLIALLLVEVSGVHGNSIAFNQYGRKVLQATYLAKRIMSQIEYNASIRSPLKDMAMNEKDKPFEDAPDFTYSVSMEPLPNALDLMLKIMSGGMMAGGEEGDEDGESKDGGAGAMLEQIKGLIQQSIGDEPIWVARVEVAWTDGARRDAANLSMIIADTKKLEDSVGKLLDAAPSPVVNQPGSKSIPSPIPNPAGGPQGPGVPNSSSESTPGGGDQ